ncbi:lysylphosphatidylglycerol synthase transmembrane domain-containing protein [Actinoplanes derwentensis]|uniref:lysylphosphatidylglycerol synthase transmembrane domain-containing protein n=1 Tax=Actinoplanes derwentensis TaxID=113562 RepID=UPI000B8458F6|nr:lysylphosphatidylglycerol synthase transmembrane domain-containing protein [Actinoplanes derwentensis]
MNRSIWAWLRLLGGAAILALVLWRLGTGAFVDGLRVLDMSTLVAALGIGAATTVLSAWRWCLVARGLGMRLTLKDATADYYQALFLNAALPGGILGDVGRAVRHGKDEGDLGRGVRAVVLERTAGQLVLLLVGAAVLFSVPSPVLDLLKAHGPLVAAVTASIAAAGVLVLFVVRKLRGGHSKAAGAARTGLAEIRSGLLSRRSGPGVLLASAAVLAGHLATFLVAAKAAGSVATVLELAPLLLLALIAMGLPVNIGGWGPREGVMAWAFGAAGLSAAQGLTIAVAYGILAFVAAAPGAAILVVRMIANRRTSALIVAPVPAPMVAPVPALTAAPAPAVFVSPAPAVAALPVIVPLQVRQPAYSGGVAA